MKSRKLIFGFALLSLLILSAPAARAQLSRLKFGSYKISSIMPRSLRSCDGAVQVAVRNDTTGFVMSGISGLVYRSGVPFVQGTASNVDVRHGHNTLLVSGNVTLCEGVSLWTVLGCLVSFNASEFTGDVRMTITMDSGESRVVEKQGISVGAILANRFKRKK